MRVKLWCEIQSEKTHLAQTYGPSIKVYEAYQKGWKINLQILWKALSSHERPQESLSQSAFRARAQESRSWSW